MLKHQDMVEIRDFLKQANIKVTVPRLLTLRVLKHASEPMTAYDIEAALYEFDDRINLASIYSSLKTFQNVGIIQRYKSQPGVQSVYIFAGTISPIRVICRQCGSIECLDHSDISECIKQSSKQHQLSVASFHLTVNVDACKHCL